MADDFSEAVLFRDDSICVRYADGRVLQLSPCASAFLFHHPGHRPANVQQLTRFAVSSFKAEVIAAVRMRNQFAERPYMCTELLNKKDIIVNYKEIKECTWPISVIPDFVVLGDDGSVHVKSMDSCAHLLLAPNQQIFTVNFLAVVSPCNKDKKQVPSTSSSKPQYQYTWTGHQHSVHDYPECWHHPLQLALTAAGNSNTVSLEGCYGDSKSTLPRSLPVWCSFPHLHKWKPCQTIESSSEELFWQKDIKVVWRDGIIYRVCKGSKQGLHIQINPCDGSVLTSSSRTGKFFTHYFANKGKVEDKVISVDKPSRDQPYSKYSIAKLVRQGHRLLEFISSVELTQSSITPTPCWMSKIVSEIPAQPSPPQVIETANIPDIGRFKAYSNGHLHAAFEDRTVIDVRYTTSYPQDPPGITSKNQFNAILPDGRQVQGTDGTPEGLQKHIQMLRQWGDWVNATPEQRRTFYKNTIWDYDAARAVDAEINKLRRFNYIMNKGKHSSSHQYGAITQNNQPDSVCTSYHGTCGNETIRQAMEHTSKAIQDIEKLLVQTKENRK